jgi:hypothetical protein
MYVLGRWEIQAKFYSKKHNGKNLLEDLRLEGSVILKWILRKLSVNVCAR